MITSSPGCCPPALAAAGPLGSALDAGGLHKKSSLGKCTKQAQCRMHPNV